MEREKRRKINVFLPLIFSFVLVLGMYLGSKMQSITSDKTSIVKNNSKNKVQQVLEYINYKYVDTVNAEALASSAITGVLKQLDPHSVYIPAKQFQYANEALKGNFEGIGIEFFIVDDTIMVVTPITGGPSAALGIQAGDRIVKIDEEKVAGIGITNQGVVKKLRGLKGTKVNVSISRSGVENLIEYTIVRDKIPLHSVEVGYLDNDNVGYIKINRFGMNTYREFYEILEQLQQGGMQSLILDLRDNPGGYLNAATKIAGEFLKGKKLIVYTEGKSQARHEYYSTKKGRFTEGKLILLINEGSASASEILAGALQDWDRGKIVGRRSFGKGLVQEQYIFPDSSAIRLTTARYYTPLGRGIQKPYKNGFKDYYNELIQRYKHGELENPDSIVFIDSLKYITPAGNEVYGGGGIMPDVFVPIDTTGNSAYFNKILNMGLIPKFAYSYVANNRASFAAYKNIDAFKNNVQVDDEIISKFKDYAEKQGVTYKEISSKVFLNKLITLLKAYMAKQIWDAKGYYIIMHNIDPAFKQAYEIIKSNT